MKFIPVSKEEYDSCRVINSNARIIALCDKPHYAKYFTITFRSFTPQPGGLEFKPGQDYYFITTSTGRAGGLNQKVGGRCSTHHMKMIFKVCCSSNNSNHNDKNESSSNASNGFAKEQLNSSSSSSSSYSSSFPLPFPSPSDLNGLDFHKNTLLNKITNNSSNNPSINFRQNGADPFTINNNDLRGSQSGQPIDSHSVFSNSNSVNIVNPNRLETISNDRMITNHSNQKINSGGSRSASSLFSSPSPILPTSPTSYWWRPHFTKLPSLKHNNDVNNLRPGASESDGRSKNGSNGWVIIIGSAVGVTIACVVICALFACTNYLFFPPRRKQQLSKC